jgi:hypothetical protein
VRHLSGGPGKKGQVGLFVGGGQWSGRKGLEHCHCDLTFNDDVWVPSRWIMGLSVGALGARGAGPFREEVQPPSQRLMGLKLRHCRGSDAQGGWFGSAGLLPRPMPTERGPQQSNASWHRLALEVRPTEIRGLLDGQEAGARSPAELADDWCRLTRDRPLPAGVSLPSLSGGVGLVVIHGCGAFRNVVLEPLGEEIGPVP